MPRLKQTTEKPKNFKATTKKLITTYLSKYKIALLVVFVFAIGSTIFTIIGPKILRKCNNRNFQWNYE